MAKVGDKVDAVDIKFFENEIRAFKVSKKRKDMVTGQNYFRGAHDILCRKREVINENGELEEVVNLPNHKIVDNQYAKMVSQKGGYLCGKPFTIRTKNKEYSKFLGNFFNFRFMRMLKRIAKDSLNCGLGWICVYYDDGGELRFKHISARELCPGWADSEHTDLDYAIRIYEIEGYDDLNQPKIFEKAEIYTKGGVYDFDLVEGKLLKTGERKNFFSQDGFYNWVRIPLVPFRYNEDEIPLINKVKSIQDAINLIKSNFQNSMSEDIHNTIMVLINYDGQNLGEFRKNLSEYGVIKVSTIDGVAGDVRTLRVEVNSENYRVVLDLLKKAFIENAMGYDAKDDRLSGNANKMNIQSMYSDIDLDADDMESEYQAAFEELLWFINMHLFNTGQGDFEEEQVEIIFNRDILINEKDVIENIQKSQGVLSLETLIAQHPWVDDPQSELEKIEKEKQAEMEQYSDAFIKKEVADEEKESGILEK